ncbi:hypothetical protein [Erythrobacter litoralis]|uniref:Uncharacterized protein n=1 Tax=Erythrobacter litoralis (strain HTCC2594) TaxID=314225 RepID=Q2NB31_ERYLH|nr:hypothetical protein [Erythrobacter litoralis]ABC63110.1 hypothetical protein ELI_05090 [Erythrobacter litoralis HTCC2594]
MRRQILTLLALLTGLAAVGVPAQAAMGEMFGPQVQSDSQSEKRDQREECRTAKDSERSPIRREGVKPCPPRKTVKIYLPTVMLGSDRAYE